MYVCMYVCMYGCNLLTCVECFAMCHYFSIWKIIFTIVIFMICFLKLLFTQCFSFFKSNRPACVLMK